MGARLLACVWSTGTYSISCTQTFDCTHRDRVETLPIGLSALPIQVVGIGRDHKSRYFNGNHESSAEMGVPTTCSR
jgi:hypothetical protein